MTDTTHNTIVTILLVLAGIILFALLNRAFFGSSVSYYQPASAYNASYPTINGFSTAYPSKVVYPYGQSSVVTYSQPTTSYTYVPSDTQYSTSYEQQTYSYSCDGYGHCWTNQ